VGCCINNKAWFYVDLCGIYTSIILMTIEAYHSFRALPDLPACRQADNQEVKETKDL